MKYLTAFLIFIAAYSQAATTPTKNVLQETTSKAVTDSIVIPTGKSITINSGATITNNGTATGFGSGGTWGSITGTLSAQTDLQTVLDAKQALNANLTTLSAGFGAFSGMVIWDGSAFIKQTSALITGFGGTGISTYAVGDLLYGSVSGLSKLSGNTTTTKRFLTQTGDGTASAAPAWGAILAADVPTLNQNTTGTAAGLSATLAVASGGTGITSFGTGIATWLGTPTSANLAAAITNETGTGLAVFNTSPSFTGSIVVNQSGQSELAGMEVVADPANGAVRALYILPPANGGRIYFGKTGQGSVTLNFGQVGGIESFPSSVNRAGSLQFVLFGAGSLNLDADFSGGGRVNVSTTTTAGSLQVNNTYTSTTSFEGLRLAWASNVASIKPVAGGGGGTVRTAQYFTTGTVFLSSGSGSPESVVTAPIGSIYTRTDGGANTTLYIKESGTGNTGWIAK